MMAEKVAKIATDAGVPYIFKASYDKANRTSVKSFRGPGAQEGLRILGKIKADLKVPCSPISMMHRKPGRQRKYATCCKSRVSRAADGLLIAAGKTGRIINIKKAQYLSPWDMPTSRKVASTGNSKILLTERGASFGYQNLVVDFRSFPVMQKTVYPVVFDVTHSVQLPGGQGHASGASRNLSSRWLAQV